MTSCHNLHGWRRAISVLLGLAALAGCGGGVDSGGTGAPEVYAAGPVTGLGSVFVSDVRFDDDTASIADEDGNPITADQVKVGMLARIDAGPILQTNGQPAAAAVAIRLFSEIVGPVDSVDPIGSSMGVLGQTVRITPATWFDDALAGGLTAVTPGQVVEVYGLYNVFTGRYIATRIVPRSNPSHYEIRGLLAGVNASVQTLTVGGLTISTASAGALPALTVGEFVRVKLALLPTGNVWTATSVAAGRTPVPDRPDARVVGRISAWTSSRQFSVYGIPVDASAATFPAGEIGVVLGARVAVQGSVSGGVLHAVTVTFKGDETLANSTFEFHGPILALDTVAQTLSVRGIPVHYSAQVQFISGAIGDLALGKRIVVVGTLSADRRSIDAQTITFF